MLVGGLVMTFGYDIGVEPPTRPSETFNEEVALWQSGYLTQLGIQASFMLSTVIVALFTMLWQSCVHALSNPINSTRCALPHHYAGLFSKLYLQRNAA